MTNQAPPQYHVNGQHPPQRPQYPPNPAYNTVVPQQGFMPRYGVPNNYHLNQNYGHIGNVNQHMYMTQQQHNNIQPIPDLVDTSTFSEKDWQPSQGESQILDKWFDELNDGTGFIGGAKAVAFLKNTHLSRDILRTIWGLVDNKQMGKINRYQFYKVIRLVSIAISPLYAGSTPTMERYHNTAKDQFRLPDLSVEELHHATDNNTKGFNTPGMDLNQSQMSMPVEWQPNPQEKSLLDGWFNSLDENKSQLIGGPKIAQFLYQVAPQLQKEKLKTIWAIVDTQGMGYINRIQFYKIVRFLIVFGSPIYINTTPTIEIYQATISQPGFTLPSLTTHLSHSSEHSIQNSQQFHMPNNVQQSIPRNTNIIEIITPVQASFSVEEEFSDFATAPSDHIQALQPQQSNELLEPTSNGISDDFENEFSEFETATTTLTPAITDDNKNNISNFLTVETETINQKVEADSTDRKHETLDLYANLNIDITGNILKPSPRSSFRESSVKSASQEPTSSPRYMGTVNDNMKFLDDLIENDLMSAPIGTEEDWDEFVDSVNVEISNNKRRYSNPFDAYLESSTSLDNAVSAVEPTTSPFIAENVDSIDINSFSVTSSTVLTNETVVHETNIPPISSTSEGLFDEVDFGNFEEHASHNPTTNVFDQSSAFSLSFQSSQPVEVQDNRKDEDLTFFDSQIVKKEDNVEDDFGDFEGHGNLDSQKVTFETSAVSKPQTSPPLDFFSFLDMSQETKPPTTNTNESFASDFASFDNFSDFTSSSQTQDFNFQTTSTGTISSAFSDTFGNQSSFDPFGTSANKIEDIFSANTSVPSMTTSFTTNRTSSNSFAASMSLKNLEMLAFELEKRCLYEESNACIKQAMLLSWISDLNERKKKAVDDDDLESALQLKQTINKEMQKICSHEDEIAWSDAVSSNRKGCKSHPFPNSNTNVYA
jgi:hypothetical protein